MELVNDGQILRVRQGANRFAQPGKGLAEFAFHLDRPMMLYVHLRMRSLDECGNTIAVSLNGLGAYSLRGREVYGQWLWTRDILGRFFQPGLHRVTLHTREDGVEVDRIVLTSKHNAGSDPGYLESIVRTPAPAFDRLPVASPVLPAVERVSAQAMPTDSLVFGHGHTNTLTVFTRLNSHDHSDIQIRVSGLPARLRDGDADAFTLTRAAPVRFTRFEVEPGSSAGYLASAQIEVIAEGETVHMQQVDFIRPLHWAFLGPFEGPDTTDLDHALPPEALLKTLHLRPDIPGYVWRVVVDGSCYDEFGIVDLNKVFDLPNPPWTRHSKLRPQAAYAVTVLQSHQHPHATIAFAGDDGLRVWRNGRHLLTQTCDSPLETKRQIVGVQLDDGMNAFVFRAPQTRFYWQLLFEPDTHFPYGNPRSFRPVPIDQWRGEGQQPRQAR